MAGAAVLAAEELGLAQRCLEMTMAYLKERRQFAQPIGSFQALKRRRSGKRGRRPGGTGLALGHPAHLHLRRAEASPGAVRHPGAHRAALAGLVNLPGPGA